MDRVVGVFGEDECGARPGGQNVVGEVGFVDGFPNGFCSGDGFVVAEVSVAAKVGAFLRERGVAQGKEAVDVPGPDVRSFGVNVDGEIEEVGDCKAGGGTTWLGACGLEDVESFDDEDVGAGDGLSLPGDDVVGEVVVDGGVNVCSSRFDPGQKADQCPTVVGFGKSFAPHDVASLEFRVGQEKSVGGDEFHAWCVGPSGEHFAQDAGGG